MRRLPVMHDDATFRKLCRARDFVRATAHEGPRLEAIVKDNSGNWFNLTQRKA